MACDPTASGFETAEGKVAIPELLTVTAGWSAPSTVKTTDPTGHERSRCSQDRSTHRGGTEGRRGYIEGKKSTTSVQLAPDANVAG
jgi:hypothetical protein